MFIKFDGKTINTDHIVSVSPSFGKIILRMTDDIIRRELFTDNEFLEQRMKHIDWMLNTKQVTENGIEEAIANWQPIKFPAVEIKCKR